MSEEGWSYRQPVHGGRGQSAAAGGAAQHLHALLREGQRPGEPSTKVKSSTTSPFLSPSLSLSLSLSLSSLQISASVLKQLVEKIRETLQGLDTSEDIALTKTYFENILQHTKLAEGEFYKGVEF